MLKTAEVLPANQT